jgi:hypothetical protein
MQKSIFLIFDARSSNVIVAIAISHCGVGVIVRATRLFRRLQTIPANDVATDDEGSSGLLIDILDGHGSQVTGMGEYDTVLEPYGFRG